MRCPNGHPADGCPCVHYKCERLGFIVKPRYTNPWLLAATPSILNDALSHVVQDDPMPSERCVTVLKGRAVGKSVNLDEDTWGYVGYRVVGQLQRPGDPVPDGHVAFDLSGLDGGEE